MPETHTPRSLLPTKECKITSPKGCVTSRVQETGFQRRARHKMCIDPLKPTGSSRKLVSKEPKEVPRDKLKPKAKRLGELVERFNHSSITKSRLTVRSLHRKLKPPLTLTELKQNHSVGLFRGRRTPTSVEQCGCKVRRISSLLGPC